MDKGKVKKMQKIIISLLLIPVILLLLIFMWLTIDELISEHKLSNTNLSLLYVDECDGIFLMERLGGHSFSYVVDEKDFRTVYWNEDKIVGITYGEKRQERLIKNGKRRNYFLISKNKGDQDYVVEKFDPTIDFDSLLINTFGDTLACHKYHWKRMSKGFF